MRVLLVGLAALAVLGVFPMSSAFADGAGTISCSVAGGGSLPIANSGDYALSPGQTISCSITGASAPATGNGATNVYVKHGGTPTTSTSYPLTGGNEVVPATYSNGTVTFTYTTTGLNTCKTAALSYNDPSGSVNNSKGANSDFDFNGTGWCVTAKSASALGASASGSASYTRTYTWGVSKSVDQSSASYLDGSPAPTFNYTVTVTHDGGADSSFAAAGTISASNPNSASVSGVTASLADSNCSVSGGAQTISGNGSAGWSFTCSYTAAGPASLAATVAWPAQTLSDSSVLAAGNASASASLSWASPTTVVDGSVNVVDSVGNVGSVSSGDASPTSILYPLQLDASAGRCRSFTNDARIVGSTSGTLGADSKTVTVCNVVKPALIDASDPASNSYTRTYGWTVGKGVDSSRQNIPAGSQATFNYTVTVTHDAGIDSGWKANGSIVVTNGNSADINGVSASVTDPNCVVAEGSQTVPANGSATWTYSCAWTSAPPASTGLSVSWDGQTLSNGGDLPGGTATGTQPFGWGAPTTVVNGSVDVTDSRAGSLGTASVGGSNPTTFSYPLSFSGQAGTCTDYGNTASISTGDSASANVTVCDGVDLTASATSGTSFTRSYTWGVSKSVNGAPLIEKAGGGTGSFSYTVAVTHDAGTDSNWQVAGSITVNNPNDWEAIVANVSDAIDNGGTCAVANGSDVSIAAGGSVTLSYTCSYASAPSALSGNDTVTISWDSAANATPDGSTSPSAAYAFGAPTSVVNGTTVVNDSLKGALGTLNALTSAGTTNYTYTLSFAVPSSNCVTHPNVASLSVGGSANASVELCGYAATGALSKGYWSNKNGSAVITGSASTGGVCNVGTWLRQYAPFQDLAAGSSCSAVNTYVSKVIGAATSGGSTANPMLKAQMLAVALDVYFGSSGIGNLSIDTQHVGGSEDTSGAFGGATRMSMLQMLAYASSQSNVGGTSWYGQNKATQLLAADMFNAICNVQVFAP